MRGQLKNANFFSKILALAAMCIMFGVIFSILGTLTATWVFSNFDLTFGSLTSGNFSDVPPIVLQWIQIFSATGLFVMPAAIFSWLNSNPGEDFLAIHKPLKLNIFIFSAVLVLAFLPIIDLVTNFMYDLPFPESMQAFRDSIVASDERNAELVKNMLAGNTIFHLIMNLFVVAVLPAIGEELLFRGTLQSLLLQRIRSPFLAIGLTSILFAAMHQQFFNLPGLLIISMILGYLRHWTGNLRASMVTHFVNNALVVVIVWFTGMNPSDPLPVENSWMWFVLGVILTGGLMYSVFYFSKKAN
jgi:membrane protease YdiL (CAAX protease family)